MAHAEADARTKELSLSIEQQLANGVMLSAMMRTLQLVVGGTSPLRMPSIWSATCSNHATIQNGLAALFSNVKS